MSTDRLIYLPLGGAGEIGMNAYVYGYGPKDKERLIVVDLGVTFPDMDGTPGVDLIFPDISWLEERRNQIEAIFITHAHEDHVGAVGHLWEKLGAPIYAALYRPYCAGQTGRIWLAGNWCVQRLAGLIRSPLGPLMSLLFPSRTPYPKAAWRSLRLRVD